MERWHGKQQQKWQKKRLKTQIWTVSELNHVCFLLFFQCIGTFIYDMVWPFFFWKENAQAGLGSNFWAFPSLHRYTPKNPTHTSRESRDWRILLFFPMGMLHFRHNQALFSKVSNHSAGDFDLRSPHPPDHPVALHHSAGITIQVVLKDFEDPSLYQLAVGVHAAQRASPRT